MSAKCDWPSKEVNLGHNLVSLLYAIKGNGETYFERTSDAPSMEWDRCQKAEAVLRKTLKLAEDALNVTKRLRPGAHRRSGTGKTNLRGAVSRAVRRVNRELPDRQVRFILHIPKGFPDISCAKSDFEEVVFQLLKNAVESACKPVCVAVRAHLIAPLGQRPSALINIGDNGPGIDLQKLPRLFLPFYSTKFECGGNGLGLCLAQALTMDNGGRISVSSYAGSGTNFSLEFGL